MKTLDLRMLKLMTLCLAICLTFVGCATSGGGSADRGATTKAPKAPDYKNEMGENGLPTPRALVARYVDAVGGADAIRAHESMTVKGKMEMAAMGMSGDVTVYAKAPDKNVVAIELPGMGSMNNGYNGEIGWSINPMTGPALLEGKMLTQAAIEADFYGELNYEKHYPTMETVEETTWADQAAYKVKLIDTEGSESTRYFAKDSALLIGQEGKQESEMGEMEVSVVISDYKDFGSLKLPASTTMSMMGMEIKQTVDSVTFDDVDDSKFEPPAEIKALVE